MCHFLGQAIGLIIVLAIVSGVFYVAVKIPIFFIGAFRDMLTRRKR
jgi:hypothetical protein